MRIRFANIVLAAALATATSAVSQDNKFAPIDACYAKQALSMDDRVSDALSVARIIRFMCNGEERAVASTAAALEALNEPLLMRAGTFVLQARAMARADAAGPKK